MAVFRISDNQMKTAFLIINSNQARRNASARVGITHTPHWPGGGSLGIYGVSCLCRFISDMAFLMNQK